MSTVAILSRVDSNVKAKHLFNFQFELERYRKLNALNLHKQGRSFPPNISC